MERRSDEAPAHDAPRGPTAPPRPLPDQALRERLVAWGAWFGLPRLVATAVCMLVVAGGGYWLVRAPAPATEARLSRSAATITVTLPEPVPSTSPGAADGGEPVTAHTEIIVHVAGEVVAPGVYVLHGAPRVHDAIEVAGGPSGAADLDALNLAATLVDGQRLYVPAIGDVEPGVVVLPDPPATDGGGDAASPSAERPVDLNRATAAELDTLPGIGPSTAQAIVDDRDRNGPFARVDDLERVPGIGPAKLDAVRDLVVV
jgi:competence protein ComEA